MSGAPAMLTPQPSSASGMPGTSAMSVRRIPYRISRPQEKAGSARPRRSPRKVSTTRMVTDVETATLAMPNATPKMTSNTRFRPAFAKPAVISSRPLCRALWAPTMTAWMMVSTTGGAKAATTVDVTAASSASKLPRRKATSTIHGAITAAKTASGTNTAST